MHIVFASMEEAYELAKSYELSVMDECKDFTPVRRKSFLSSRALLLLMLKTFYNCRLNSLPQMVKVSGGKPVFLESRYPNFNISHSKNTVCIALSSENEYAGIDIEYIKDRKNLDGLIDRVMSEDEKAYIRSLEDNDKIKDFFTAMWTVRESVIKASGRGLVDIQSISINPVKANLSYYLLPSSLKVQTVRFDSLDKSQSPSYLSFVFGKKESPLFYTLKEGSLLLLDNSDLSYCFSVS